MVTSTPTLATAPLSSRRAAGAVFTLFAVNGLLLGGYAGSIPSLRDRLDLSATQIAVMLIGAGVAGIVSMQFGGRLTDSIGARRVALTGLPLLITGCLVVGFAPGYGFVIGGASLVGLGNGAMDVAMNALAVQVEQARRNPIMSRFHAFFSLGNFAGAGAVLLIARAFSITGGAVVLPLMLTLCAVAAITLVMLLRITPPAQTIDHTVDGVRVKIPRLAWILGVMALSFGLAEGTAVDWSSLHVTDVASVDSSTGALGLIAVSGSMVVIRLCGDRLVTRFGRRQVVRFGGACGALGYVLVTLVTGLPLIIVGWALVGLGVGMIAPQVYAVAGHLGGGRVLAVVVTFGYAAFLIGPAVVGFGVEHLGVQHVMAVPAVLCAGIVALAVTMPKDDDVRPQH